MGDREVVGRGRARPESGRRRVACGGGGVAWGWHWVGDACDPLGLAELRRRMRRLCGHRRVMCLFLACRGSQGDKDWVVRINIEFCGRLLDVFGRSRERSVGVGAGRREAAGCWAFGSGAPVCGFLSRRRLPLSWTWHMKRAPGGELSAVRSTSVGDFVLLASLSISGIGRAHLGPVIPPGTASPRSAAPPVEGETTRAERSLWLAPAVESRNSGARAIVPGCTRGWDARGRNVGAQGGHPALKRGGRPGVEPEESSYLRGSCVPELALAGAFQKCRRGESASTGFGGG